MAQRYRELSFTRRAGDTGASVMADTDIILDGQGRSYVVVRSRTNRLFTVPVPMEGDPKVMTERVLRERRLMAEYDARHAPGVPLLKPHSRPEQRPCPACLGEGECEDMHGNWKPCRQCSGSGYVDSV